MDSPGYGTLLLSVLQVYPELGLKLDAIARAISVEFGVHNWP